MNKKERVAKILENTANLNKSNADKVMMEAHTTGKGVIHSFENRSDAERLWMDLRKEDLLVEVQLQFAAGG